MKSADVLALCSDITGIPRAALVGPSRSRSVAQARMFSYAMLRRFATPAPSLPAIGMRMGDRDHTTILHGIRVWETSLRLTDYGARWHLEFLARRSEL